MSARRADRIMARSLARLQRTVGTGRCLTPAGEAVEKWGHTMKKLLVLTLVALGGLLVWRKVQADRAELDLWTEATGSEN
jgi:hypothetical protein